MWIRGALLTLLSAAMLGLAIEADAGKEKDVKKDAVKDAPKKDAKKFEVPKNAITGIVKSIDHAKSSFTITVDKKDRVFLVDKATEFYGPKGGDRGTGTAGLKDEVMAAGNEIRVEPTADGKTAKNVYLPNRKTDTKEKDKKDKK